MAWDTEGTKRKILDAATAQFAASGPDGTTIEWIAKQAGVNKERVYNYFGGKSALFEQVLREQVTTAAAAVPVPSSSPEDVGEYAGRLYDYLLENPSLIRLLQWEALTLPGDVPDEAQRTRMYAQRTAEFAHGQNAGRLSRVFDPDLLNVLILGLVGYWIMLPQVARMVSGPAEAEGEAQRRRAAIVEAARRLAWSTS